jgi:hypothetical protein
MADSINWLHFTDLHLGLDDEAWLWPRSRHDLFRDVEKISREVDGWDLVFFTGDLVQSGKAAEFDRLNKELETLWTHLSKSGRTPQICVVPGNHDLTRPAADAAITKTLSQLWSTDEQLRRQFWKEPDCEYRSAVNAFFTNYSNWLEKISVPLLKSNTGILPGDFGATFRKNSITLGILGLNTTFLQIVKGDLKGKLDIHISQLNAVCGGDPETWISACTSTVLLTHQPPSWLTPEAYEHFRQEIYPPGRFLAHLCGHQHEPEAFDLSEAGGAPRRFRQGPSLFGLEHWEGVSPKQRIHGYNAGQFVFESNGNFEKLWPRLAVKGRHGGLNLSPDHSYTLREGDCVITPFDLRPTEILPTTDVIGDTTKDTAASQETTIQLLENSPNESAARLDLAFCPRMPQSAGVQHRYVRQDEQSQCEHELRKSRCLWLVADWGLGEEGFLVTLLDRFRTQTTKLEAFHLKCDEAADIDVFESLFSQQFGMPLQPFCYLVTSITGAFLILEGIHPDLCKEEHFPNLQRVVGAVVDYCPNLKIILVSRLAPPANTFPTVAIRPLDAPDARSYLMHHPDATPEVEDSDTIEKIYERSEGLPMHIDRILKALKVTTLPSVLEAELEGSSLAEVGQAPVSLIHTVSQLAKSPDKRSKRSFRLLKVLSVLPYGETLDSLAHYLPTEPFFLENALQLSELTLLDVVPLQRTTPQMRAQGSVATDPGLPKLLKVPRQVRDYVQTLLSDEERLDIVLAGIERFFGREWRDGKVKLRSLPVEYREYLASGAGNEFALIHHLIAHARTAGETKTLQRGAALGVRYARHLKASDRYRDLSLVAGGLTQLLDRDQQADDWARLSALFGEGLRMTGKREEALRYLRDSLDAGVADLNESEKASIWLDIALAEESLKNNDSAIDAAKEVKALAKQDSGQYLQAESILASLTLKGASKAKRLTELETLARKGGHTSLAATIALEFASAADTPSKKIMHLDKVLSSKSNGYNRARAIVAKAEALSMQDESKQLRSSDLLALSSAYSYLHAQRFSSLFDRCNEQLWKIFESKGDSAQLLRLFRHTSFIWRIRGEQEKEAEYLKRLEKRNVKEESLNAKGLIMEVTYFLRRLKIVISDALS